jgi:SAM-dependent methyltransferase
MSAACADLNPSEYDAFAPYYDAFTAESDYEAWTAHVLRVARAHGLAGMTLLDVACGTGKSFMPFLRRGFRVTGCDSSAAMLAEAAAKAPGVPLERCDMRALPDLGRFDLVTCVDDALNYLLNDRELLAAFEGMESSLAAGGVIVFDVNSLLAYRTTFATHAVTERGDVVFAWRGSSSADAAPGCEAVARLDVFDPAGSGLYERVTVIHRQRHFPRVRVERLLRAAGLECLSALGVLPDCSLVQPADELAHPKVVYVARHRRGGDEE